MISFIHIDDGCYGIMVMSDLISEQLNKVEFVQIRDFLLAVMPEYVYNENI